MKNSLFLLLLVFTFKSYGKTPFIGKIDSNYMFLFSSQLRADFKTPYEYQFIVFRPEKLSFSFKVAKVNYLGENLGVGVNSGSNTKFVFNHVVKGFTFKPGILFAIERNGNSIINLGLNGVFTNITNEVSLTNNAVGYYETYKGSNYLFGAELEFTQMVFFLKYFHLGLSEVIGYKNMNVYNLEGYIGNYPKSQTYAPTQGYSPIPVYISLSAFLGVNF